jgi:hypothetical protein
MEKNVPVENVENIEPPAVEPEKLPKKRGRPPKIKPVKIKKPPSDKQLAYWKLLKQRNSKKKKEKKVVLESDDDSSLSSSSSASSSSEDEKKSKKAPKKPVLKRSFAEIPEYDSSSDDGDDGFLFA